MKWIIVDGCDNIGKSTLIDSLKTLYPNASIDHFGAPVSKTKEEQINEQRALAFSYVDIVILTKSENDIVINDRSIFGELVYSHYRDYEPDYYPLLVSNLEKRDNIKVLFVLIHADSKTYDKFNIPKKSEKHKYEDHDQSAFISSRFIEKIHKLNYGKILVFNSNNYSSLDERNKYIKEHIKCFIENRNYKFMTVNSYANIPFSNEERYFCSDDTKFVSSNFRDICALYKICPIAGEHRHFCEYGKKYNENTHGYGSIDMVKYLFVGEAPGYNGCGKLGIPFYDDVSGNIFQQALYDNNISQFNVYTTNIIKCTPKGNKLGKYKGLNYAMTLRCVQDFAKEVIPIIEYNKLNTIYAVGLTPYTIASYLFRGRGINIHRLYHPAYFARTGSANKYSEYLGRELKINVNT